MTDASASATHTTFRRENGSGKITNTGTWTPNEQNPSGFDLRKRVDKTGGSHRNRVTGEDIPTPHTHDKRVPGGVRKASKSEL
ncbi:MAG: hypothetical protein RLN81_02265 [Balneolaceae bacterium]